MCRSTGINSYLVNHSCSHLSSSVRPAPLVGTLDLPRTPPDDPVLPAMTVVPDGTKSSRGRTDSMRPARIRRRRAETRHGYRQRTVECLILGFGPLCLMHAPKRDNPGRDVVQRSVMDAEIRSTDTLSGHGVRCAFLSPTARGFFLM